MQFSGPARTRAALAAATVAALVLGLPAVSNARTPDDSLLTPRTHFVMQADGSSGATTKGAGIPNIDSVKSTIRAYYGAVSGIANKDSSPYISEMAAMQADILSQMPTAPAPNLAVVFDADDTTLWTYDMEDAAMKFNFDPTLQGQWVHDRLFPATPGMVDFVRAVQDKGYNVYGITGRGEAQESDTLANLADVGYSEFDADNFFTKFSSPGTKPDYLDCNTGVDTPAGADDPTKCTTVEYKAGTRKHIQEDLGQTIVLNIGDQWSDLQGGYSLNTVKLPNPTYYLPSPDITGAPAGDSSLTPRTEFTMAADGSSAATEGGEGIPNIDSVKSTIRTYYGAVGGIADKETSPYIAQLTKFSQKWGPQLHRTCARQTKRGSNPAVVFDADDTTLWTYDMEDAAMKFNFDPALQNTWVQEERFVPTPKMRRLVRAARVGGCAIVGLTGRNDAQRAATIDNLNKYYDDAFTTKLYFTKWTGVGDSQQPSYITCAAVKCTTVEYKSQTRAHVERMGYRIVANFGDQFSDLLGGHAERAVKLPNVTYYLP